MAINIKIGMGDTTTGKLDLSDNGRTEAEKGRNIKWKTRSGSNVKSFEIKIKSDPDNIFSIRPNKDDNQWKAKIKDNAIPYTECEYVIPWIDKDGYPHEHDPKIAVKPTAFSPYGLILLLFSIVIGLFSLRFLRRK